MNFKRLYETINRRTVDALLSLWATGDKQFQDYIRYLLENEEPLTAEPVFQATFPWETSNVRMAELESLFSKEFITALDNVKGEYRFRKDLKSYTHQLKSWKALLEERKSIIVTSGTGSGKTECFMIPVLHDLHQQALTGHGEGVGALFLYPLNALMGSQKYRMSAWTKAIGGKVRFAIYNGKTPETETGNKRKEALPEVIDREKIRSNPPQILFTNPTMLEYMLIRQKDQSIIDKSKGKLRWILLDEAHTYSGSTAAEMAMLIRRVLDAFEMNIEDVRFAATSATISGGDQKEQDLALKQFLAEISGKSKDSIEVIGGQRVLGDPLPAPDLHTKTLQSLRDTDFESKKRSFEVQQIRKECISTPAFSLSELGKKFGCESVSEQLELADLLSEGEKDALLPLRAHLFIRTVPGIYACTNPFCKKHSHIRRSESLLGTFTTRLAATCSECGFPLLEVAGCSCCGTQFLKGQYDLSSDQIRLTGSENNESFELDELPEDESDNDEETSYKNEHWDVLWLIKSQKPVHDWFPCGISNEGKKIDKGPYYEISEDKPSCPICGESLSKAIYYRTSSTFLSRTLLPTFLEEAPPARDAILGQLWDGRKMLAFTDNRQGTARSAAQINAEVERYWIRTRLFHHLSKERLDNVPEELSEKELEQLTVYKEHSEIFAEKIKELENRIAALADPEMIKPSPFAWKDFQRILPALPWFKVLLNLTRRNNRAAVHDNLYAAALLWGQFGRRPRRENSPETLGLIKLVYPDINTIKLSINAKMVGLSVEEWRDFLKICIDYNIRQNTYVYLPEDISPLLTQHYKAGRVFPPENNLAKKKWPRFEEKKKKQHRLVTLLCAGLGYHEQTHMSNTDIDIVNSLLQDAWFAISRIMVGNDTEGYSLDLENKAFFELMTEGYICPITNRFLDVVFKGYTPWIKGYINKENIERYKVNNTPVKMPLFKFPEGKDREGKPVDRKDFLDWVEKTYTGLKEIGLWSDIYERIFLDYPIYMAGEHSAQQKDARLRQLEKSFETGKINFLSCSTTMEMGVDIGGISMVLMNNVPPKPANYLQRAGRAGRRSEARSLAVTFCASNPVGEEALKNPKWAMVHKVDTPKVNLNSPPIIQRHVNALLFGLFVRLTGGINVKENVSNFFGLEASDCRNPALDFSAWIAGPPPELLKRIEKIKSNTVHHSKSLEALVASSQEQLENLCERTQSRVDYLKSSIDRLLQENFSSDSPAIKSLEYELQRFQRQHLLKYLVEEEFLPGAGIPIGVMEFNTTIREDLIQKKSAHSASNEDNPYRMDDIPSYHFTRALVEYAPGREVVIDGWVYKSAGIMMRTPFNDQRMLKVRYCPNCGNQQIISGDFNDTCALCGNTSFRGVLPSGGSFTEVIEPAGFSVDLFSEPKRKVTPNRGVHHVEPLLLNMDKWPQKKAAALDIRTGSEHSEIMYYNLGNGCGFAVCTVCGKTEPMYGSGSNMHHLDGHKRLKGGKENNDSTRCSGSDLSFKIRTNVVLAGRIQTDICEIRFRDKHNNYCNDESLLTTLAVALKWEFTKYTGIDEGEIDFGLRQNRINSDTFRSVFIFDTAKGGAGYATQIPAMIKELLSNAVARLKKCTCQKCCANCLVDRNSQWHLEKMDRHLVIEWYDNQLERITVPQEFCVLSEKIYPELYSFEQALYYKLAQENTKEVRLFVSGDISKWDLEEWPLSRELKRRFVLGTKISFIVDSWKSTGNIVHDFNIYSQIRSWANIYTSNKSNPQLMGLRPLAQLVNTGNSVWSWFAQNTNQLPAPDGEWDENVPEIVFVVGCGSETLELHEVPVPQNTPNLSMKDCYYQAEKMQLSRYGSYCLSTWFQKELEVVETIKNKEISVFYSDTYLMSPLGCMLFCEILRSLVAKYSVTINSVSLILAQFEEKNSRRDNKIFRNFPDNSNRNAFLKEVLICNGFKDVHIDCLEKKKMEHFRYLEIETDTHCVTIRPDGGVANGWSVFNSPSWSFPFDESVKNQVESYKIQRDRVVIGPASDVRLLAALCIEEFKETGIVQ